jgi:hypothetical protein
VRGDFTSDSAQMQAKNYIFYQLSVTRAENIDKSDLTR